MFEQVDAAHMQLSPAMRDPQAIATFSQLSLYYYLSWRFNFCFLHSSTLQREPNYFLAHACCQNTPPEAGLFQANSRSTLCWKGVLQKKARICRGEGNCRDRRHIEDSEKKTGEQMTPLQAIPLVLPCREVEGTAVPKSCILTETSSLCTPGVVGVYNHGTGGR